MAFSMRSKRMAIFAGRDRKKRSRKKKRKQDLLQEDLRSKPSYKEEGRPYHTDEKTKARANGAGKRHGHGEQAGTKT